MQNGRHICEMGYVLVIAVFIRVNCRCSIVQLASPAMHDKDDSVTLNGYTLYVEKV